MKSDATNPSAPGSDSPAAGPSSAAPAEAARNLTVLPDHDGTFVPTGANWRGITWLDVPGHDDNIKKLNFALLKRGILRGHKECAGLHGEALRQRLQDISERNRDNSLRQQQTRQRNKARAKMKPRPPPP